MSTDTDRFADELRERLSLDDLHSTLGFDSVLASSRRARRRRALIASGTVVAALAAAVLAGPPLVDWSNQTADAAHRARLAGIDGIANDLSAPLHVAWRAEGTAIAVGSGTSATILVNADGGYRVLDPETGEVRWSVQGRWCRLPLLSAARASSAAQDDGSKRVLCGNTTDGTVEVRDAVTGDVLSTVAVSWSQSQAVMIDGAVVAVGLDDERFLVARRWDATTGQVAWTYRGEARVPTESNDVAIEPGLNAVELITGSASGSLVPAITLDIATGEPLASDRSVALQEANLPNGQGAVQIGGRDVSWASTEVSVQIRAADGTEILRTPGLLDPLTVDDGSVPGLVFVENTDNSHMQAIDATTGGVLWARAGYRPIALLDQKLLVTTASDKLQLLDATTGSHLWSQQLDIPDIPSAFEPVTDGEHVLTVETKSGQWYLVARDLATGMIAWAEPWNVTDGAYLRTLPSGTVLASAGNDRITALAP